MIIKITGANGYLGKLISNQLSKNGHQVSSIKRKNLYESMEVLRNEIKNSDVIINLAGAPILKRWTKKNKSEIYNSRITTTKNLVEAICSLPQNEQPKKLISTSAIGLYKSGALHDENSKNLDNNFVSKVATDWEKALNKLPETIQKNIFRVGLVLGKNAKTIKNLVIPFKLGLGAFTGNGKQPFPFVHEQDVVNGFVWAVEENNRNGVFNLVAPENITNKEFTKAFGKQLNRPVFMRIPDYVFKLILGEASILLLESPIVEPKLLQNAGYKFKYSTIESTLSEILP